MLKKLLYIFFLLFLSIEITAQTADDTLSVTPPIVSLLTCSEGSEIYELEGHTAIRIVDAASGSDYVVNWGLFDFAAPNFVYRFVKGETDYMSGASPTSWFLHQYRSAGRKVTEQTLNLTPDETYRLISLIDECLKPENRVYRYNYVYDNCATRALSYIEQSAGDTLALSPTTLDPDINTFRKIMAHYHVNYPWYQFGIDLALGPGIDKELTLRQMTFAPVLLTEMVEKATYKSGQPVISSINILVDSNIDPVAGPTPWYLTPMFCGCLLLGIAILLTIRDMRRHRLSKWFDTILYTVFGIMGCVIFFLIFISIHEATSPNWLFLWLNPFCFIPAVAVWVKKAENLLLWYHFLNFATLIVLVNIFIFGIQGANNAFYPMIAADAIRSLAAICVIKWSKRHLR